MLYSADGLRRGHATTCLGRNQLFPSSIGLSPLDTGHASDLQISTANGPPRNFRHASTCPRLDHSVSGRILMTPRTLYAVPHSCELRTCRFPYGSGREGLNLAIRIHSLARSSKRKTEHWRRCSYKRLATSSFASKILSCPAAPSPPNFRPFAPPYMGYFSAFGHPTSTLSVSSRI